MANIHYLRPSGDLGHNGNTEPPEPPEMELVERVARIEAKLDSFATKADLAALEGKMHQEFSIQTWRIIGAILASAGLVVAGLKLIN